MKTESVKSINPFKSVIQTFYDIIKAHGGDLKVQTRERRFNIHYNTLKSCY